MRAVLLAALKQKQSLVKGRRQLWLPSTFSRFHAKPSVSFITPFSSSAMEEAEDSDDTEQDMIERADIHVLFGQLNKGLNAGSIKSGEILSLVKRLSAAGATIPISFMLDAGEAHSTLTCLRGICASALILSEAALSTDAALARVRLCFVSSSLY